MSVTSVVARQVMAEVMGAEAALVRTQLVSGTHAIATALMAVLRPGDELLAVAGRFARTLTRHRSTSRERLGSGCMPGFVRRSGSV